MSTDTMGTIEMELPDVEPVDPPKRGRGRPRKATADSSGATADSTPKDKPPRQPRAARKGALSARLTDTFTTIGLMVSMVHEGDGAAIVGGAPALGESLERLATENPKIKASLERMLSAGAWSGVFAASAPIAIAIAANHNLLPGSVATLMGGAPAPTEPHGS